MESPVRLTTLDETAKFASDLLDSLSTGTTLLLTGSLGSGKTTFTQYLGAHLGLTDLLSPTFVLLRDYPVGHPFLKHLYHLDLYRLEDISQLRGFDLSEIWSDSQNLVVIEWAERLNQYLPEHFIRLDFKYNLDKSRLVSISYS